MEQGRDTAAYYDRLAAGYGALSPDGTEHLDRLLAVLPPKASLLDLGCGAGVDARRIAARGLRVTGIDLSREMARVARRSAPDGGFVNGDLRRLPFRERAFDGALGTFSLIHVPKREVVPTLEGLRRVLRPGGGLLLVVQEGPSGERWSGGRFLNVMTEDELVRALGAAGFVVAWRSSRAPRAHEMPYRKLSVLSRAP